MGLLQEPADVVREEQQQNDQASGEPQPAPQALQSRGIDAKAIDVAASGWTIEPPERPAQAHQRGRAEPWAPSLQCCEIGDPGAADTHQDEHQGHNTAHGRANSRGGSAYEGREGGLRGA